MIDRALPGSLLVLGAVQIDPAAAVAAVAAVGGLLLARRRFKPELRAAEASAVADEVVAVRTAMDELRKQLEMSRDQQRIHQEALIRAQDAIIKAQDAMIQQGEESQNMRHQLRTDLTAKELELRAALREIAGLREQLAACHAELNFGRRHDDVVELPEEGP